MNDGSIQGNQILTPKTVKEIHTASMVARASGLLRDPNGAAGLGCDSYSFLGKWVIGKNGALDGVPSVVILIPEERSGIVVLANRQLTSFPEAVRDEFLERYIGRSGLDLQAQEKASQAGWNSLIKNPERPADASQAKISPTAFAGGYTSDLYGRLQIVQGSETGNMTLGLGPNKYQGNLPHWTNNTWYLSFPNQDDLVGYLTFTANPSGSVTGFISNEIGPFTRA